MNRLAFVLALVAAGCTKSSGPAPSDGPAAPTSGPTATAGPSAPAPAGNAELPTEVGASASSVSGCLASPGRTEQAPRSRAMETKPELVVTPVEGGVKVAHDVSHACCLESKISTAIEGGTITITESLFGTPCRCMCSSLISTSVRLGPGDYTLKVVVDHNGEKSAREQKLTVK